MLAFKCTAFGKMWVYAALSRPTGLVATVTPNVRAKRVTTVERQARVDENVPRPARLGLVACRWRSA